MKAETTLIRVCDLDDREYDLLFVFEGMTPGDAAHQVEDAVKKVKDARPEEYQFTDLADQLPEGIQVASIVTIEERW